jgi:excisionase family DNA binding protein
VDEKRLLTVPEVASILRVKPARVYELARDGLLPVTRIGRQIRIHPDQLDHWLRGGGQPLSGRKAPHEGALGR